MKVQQEITRQATLEQPTLRSPWYAWAMAELVVVGPISLLFIDSSGERASLRYFGGVLAVLFIQNSFTWAMRRFIGPEPSTVADLLTQGRGALGAVLAGLVASGFHTHLGPIAWMSWGMVLIGVTLVDWIDGPLARRLGPTLLGRVVDIEADSWLTLWSAAAVTYGGLPWWCLVPPLMHFLHPVCALLHGDLPTGGGPWWSRLTGVAQMALLLSALIPFYPAWRTGFLLVAAIPISGLQLLMQIILFFL